MAKPGKRIKELRAQVDPTRAYPLDEAITLLKGCAKAKFDESVEVALNLGVDPRHADQMVRGVVTLPNGSGRTLRVGVFARGAKADEAKAAGADVVGAEDLAAKVQEGAIEFERCIATPDMMRAVGKLGKVLIAIRDAESRTRFLGYRVESYKLFVFTLSACMAGVAGALYVPQVGIINPSEFSPANSIEAAIWVVFPPGAAHTSRILPPASFATT